MVYELLADLVLGLHLLFVLFSVLGALLVIRWPRVKWGHLPAAAWAVWIEFSGRICPLTPLENWLRVRGGGAGYAGDFVGHYLLGLLYPDGLTRPVQIILGAAVLGVNLLVYGYVFFGKTNKPRLTSDMFGINLPRQPEENGHDRLNLKIAIHKYRR